MSSNPFRYLRPVEPKDFVGRWPLVKHIASDLTQINGDSYAIIAGRRCGKSSLLNAIAHQLCQSETTDAGDFIVIPISFDFKARAETIESADDIYAHILKDIYSLIAANASFRPPDAWPQPVQLTEKYFLELTEQSAISLRDFQAGIGYILDQLDAANQHVRFVLLLDEIDDAIDRPWTQALFGQLRSLIYSSNMKSRVRLAVTGSHHLLEQVSTHGSPLCNVLKLNYLEPLDEAGFKELISRAEGLHEEATAAIWQQSGGHPFLAQYLLHHLWDRGIHLATKTNVEEMACKFLAEQVNDIKGWARGIGASGLEAYCILSAINGWIGEREIIQSNNNQSLDVKIGLIALCYHGFVLHDRGWSNYMRSGDLFKKWYDTEGIKFVPSLADQRVVAIRTESSVHSSCLCQGEVDCMDIMIKSRIRDLEANIRKDLELLQEYEEEERLTRDPRDLARIRKEIERQRASAKRYQQEYQELEVQVSNASLEIRKEVSQDLKQIQAMLAEIQSGQKTIVVELSSMRKTTLERLDASERKVISSVIEKLDQNQLDTVKVIWDALEGNRIPDQEIRATLDALQSVLQEVKLNQSAGPQIIQETEEVLKVMEDPTLSTSHKLKLSIPLIPLILSYEGEVELKGGMNLTSALKRLKAKISGK
jgi:hypothetical protein